MDRKMYTAEQIRIAARELLQAAGSDESATPLPTVAAGDYTKDQALDLLSDPLRLLAERGFTGEQIAYLISGFDIDVSAQDLGLRIPAIA
jgi:hypothetical protein